MARGPLSAAEKMQMAEFLGGLLRGRTELGIGSLGLVGIYTRARAEGLNIFDIALQDEATLAMFVDYLSKNMRRLPPTALTAIEVALRAVRPPAGAPQPQSNGASAQATPARRLTPVPITPFDRDEP
jgi:hypothetical protein